MTLWARTLVATASPEEVREAAAAHRDQLRELARSGRLRAAGEFPSGGGFLEIFEARDRLDAETVARQSPLVELGLCAWTLREWIEIEDL